MEDHNYCREFETSEDENGESSFSCSDSDEDCCGDPGIKALLTHTNIEALTYVIRMSDDGTISLVNEVPEDAGEHSYFPVTLPVSKMKSLANPFPGAIKLTSREITRETIPPLNSIQKSRKDSRTTHVRRKPLKAKRQVNSPSKAVPNPNEEHCEAKVLPTINTPTPRKSNRKSLEFETNKQSLLSSESKLELATQNVVPMSSSDIKAIASTQEEPLGPRSRVRRPPRWLTDFTGSPYL